MAVPDSLILVSEVIGFVSFAFTLLTLIGVYADLIRTLRGAPSTIPLALGNLREEIRYEQMMCQESKKYGDPFNIFPGISGKRKNQYEFTQLFSSTLKFVWTEFISIEKRFLVKGEKSWNAEDSDDEGDRFDVDEKGTGRRRKRRRTERPEPSARQSFIKSKLGWVEAGLSRDRSSYYNTDLAHRFLWWWRKDDIKNLSDQVQRLQIRRIERDAYEANILVKRGLKMYGQRSGDDVYSDSDDGDHPRGGGGSGSDDGGGGHGNHVRRRRQNGIAASRRGGRRRNGGGIREVSEKEIVRRRAPSPELSTPTRPAASAVGRRERPPKSSTVYEYEVVDPGRIRVEYESPRQNPTWQEGRQRSYSRERRRDAD